MGWKVRGEGSPFTRPEARLPGGKDRPQVTGMRVQILLHVPAEQIHEAPLSSGLPCTAGRGTRPWQDPVLNLRDRENLEGVGSGRAWLASSGW